MASSAIKNETFDTALKWSHKHAGAYLQWKLKRAVTMEIIYTYLCI